MVPCEYSRFYEPSREKTNSGLCVKYRPDHPKHAAQAYPDKHFSPAVDFLFQESLLYTFIPLTRNTSPRISLHGLRMLIWYCWFSRGTAHICKWGPTTISLVVYNWGCS